MYARRISHCLSEGRCPGTLRMCLALFSSDWLALSSRSSTLKLPRKPPVDLFEKLSPSFYTHKLITTSASSAAMLKRYVACDCAGCTCIGLAKHVLTSLPPCSGLARTLGRSAFARPQASTRAFLPLRKHALPAIATRFASSDASKTGKIHQVIGAVVDGTAASSADTVELTSSNLNTCWR